MNRPPAVEDQADGLCPRHQQRLQLFCAEDRTLLCVICRVSQEHQPHTVLPIEEAAPGYRDTLHSHMEQVNTKLQELEDRISQERKTATDLEENFKEQTEKVCGKFENRKQYLEREKQLQLQRLDEEHAETLKTIQGSLARLEEQLTTHKDLVAAMQAKCEQADLQLLADVQDFLSQCDSLTAQTSKEDSAVEQNPQGLQQPGNFHKKIVGFNETSPAEQEWRYAKGYHCKVTLDPDTAQRRLILSEEGKSVRAGDTAQDLPDAPERFNTVCIVLGRERLTSGRHYWEVKVGDAMGWGLGVCDTAASRKGSITLPSKKGYWVVILRDGKYRALSSTSTRLTPRATPRVVGLFLDYKAGRLSLYNVLDRSLLIAFAGVSFPHTLRPFFSPELSFGIYPPAALQILPVT